MELAYFRMKSWREFMRNGVPSASYNLEISGIAQNLHTKKSTNTMEKI